MVFGGLQLVRTCALALASSIVFEADVFGTGALVCKVLRCGPVVEIEATVFLTLGTSEIYNLDSGLYGTSRRQKGTGCRNLIPTAGLTGAKFFLLKDLPKGCPQIA